MSRFGIDSLLLEGRTHPSMWGRVRCYYLKIGRRVDQRVFADSIGFAIRREEVENADCSGTVTRIWSLKGWG
jgi:hypothetical protein